MKKALLGLIMTSLLLCGCAGGGYVTYRLGGSKNKDLCHIEFLDADTDEVLAKTYNQKFKEINKSYYYMGAPRDLSLDGVYAANMAEYKADLSAYLGRKIKIRLVDNASNDWGLLFLDDFRTYYENVEEISSSATLAETF